MPTYTKQPLSAAISGQQIQITGTSPATSTTIHTPIANVYDEVWLYATNIHTSDISLKLYWGATGDAGQMCANIPYQAGRALVVDGKLLSGTTNTIKASAGTANKINIDGFVNRIAP